MEPKRITPRSPRAALEPDQVPMPTRPSRRARNPFVIVGNAIITVLVLVLIVVGGALVVGKGHFEAPGPLQEDKIVNIPPRSGIMDIADLLTREGVMDAHRLVFIGGVFALNARSELKAGEYLFPKRASVKDVVDTIVEGKVVQHQLTVPEGLTSEQIVARLLESDILSGNVKDVPREGSLLPDSYHFNRGFTREQMIQRMRQAQDRLVREVWERRNPDLPLKTPEQLVILASIIEKETGKPEERTRVAAVLTNRLKQKMKLQSDPTIIYGLVFGKGTLGHPLTKSEIAQPTPYNTYVIDGLPPGPIANPGRRFDRGRGQSGAHKGTVFCGRRHRGTCVRRDLRSAPQERRASARARKRAEGRGVGSGCASARAGARYARADAAGQAQRERLVTGGRRGAIARCDRGTPRLL